MIVKCGGPAELAGDTGSRPLCTGVQSTPANSGFITNVLFGNPNLPMRDTIATKGGSLDALYRFG